MPLSADRPYQIDVLIASVTYNDIVIAYVYLQSYISAILLFFHFVDKIINVMTCIIITKKFLMYRQA